MVQKYIGLGQSQVQATNTAFTAATGVLTNINGWNASIFDPLGNFVPSTGVFTAPYNGLYLVICQFLFTTITTPVNSQYNLNLAKNGSAYVPSTAVALTPNATAPALPMALHQIVPLSPGNSLQVQLLQSTGFTQGVTGGASTNYLSIIFIPPYPTLPD